MNFNKHQLSNFTYRRTKNGYKAVIVAPYKASLNSNQTMKQKSG